MQQEIRPVEQDDTEEQVLERILSLLAQRGPTQLDEMVKVLQLYSHPAAERVLQSATSDGLIEVDRQHSIVSIRHLGREVGQYIRQDSALKKSS